jgi:allantoinase
VFDLIVRGGVLVRPDALLQADLAVEDGQIAGVGPELSGPARVEIDATGLLVMPGLIDVHVHFNEPGRAHWEGFATGSRALAAGGGTCCFDMPLNSSPPVLDRPSLEAKRAAAEAASVADFGLWGGLVPGNEANLAELAEGGVVGFKAFLCDSGLPEFPAVDDLTLYEGMRTAAALGLPVAVHAESDPLVGRMTERIRSRGGREVGDYLASRPVIAELEAVQRALLLARETGVRLHIVHVSSGRAAALIAQARAAGVDVSLETCPHYLWFTEEDLHTIGAALKSAPPVRSRSERDGLWELLQAGAVDLVASDHSPAPPALKEDEDFFGVWGGVAGVQSTLAALLTLGVAPEQVARLVSEGPASRFTIARKGRLAPGYDADFALVEVGAAWTLRPADLLQRHPVSPYLGQTFRAAVRQTVVRGRIIYSDGEAATEPWGRFVRPEQNEGRLRL